jgi:hypothetical protein
LYAFASGAHSEGVNVAAITVSAGLNTPTTGWIDRLGRGNEDFVTDRETGVEEDPWKLLTTKVKV